MTLSIECSPSPLRTSTFYNATNQILAAKPTTWTYRSDLITVRCVHLCLRFQNMHLPAYDPTILPDSRLELRNFPHDAQKPKICGPAQNNGLNFVQVTKSEVRLRICAYCICTRKSALHRILPHFQSPSKYPASGFEERLSGSFSSLHCMFSYATHCNQQS